MRMQEARNLKKGQWVLVELEGSRDEVSSFKCPSGDAGLDWRIVQQVCHGGNIVYCVDPLAYFCGSKLQCTFMHDHILQAGPMMNKPSLG